MRTPEEKERIVLEASRCGIKPTSKKYGIDHHSVREWVAKYNKGGLGCLKSDTGKVSGERRGRPVKPKNREQELELENLKLKVEVARLKKGYLAKGVGPKKEYVTIKGSNTRS